MSYLTLKKGMKCLDWQESPWTLVPNDVTLPAQDGSACNWDILALVLLQWEEVKRGNMSLHMWRVLVPKCNILPMVSHYFTDLESNATNCQQRHGRQRGQVSVQKSIKFLTWKKEHRIKSFLTVVILCGTEEFRVAQGHFYTLTFLWRKKPPNTINKIHINHFIMMSRFQDRKTAAF